MFLAILINNMVSLNKIGYYLGYVSITAILSLFTFSFSAGSAIFLFSWLIQSNNLYDTLAKISIWITVGLVVLTLFTLANICLFLSENLTNNYFSKKLESFQLGTNLLLTSCLLVVFVGFIYFGFNGFIFYISKWFWSVY